MTSHQITRGALSSELQGSRSSVSLLGLLAFSSLLICITGCKSGTQERARPLSERAKLKIELERLLEDAGSHPQRVRQKLERWIPVWREARTSLKDPARWDQLEGDFNEMREVALREIPWALSAARDSGLVKLKMHSVSLLTGRDNAPGDVELLKNLKFNPVYTISWRNPKSSGGNSRGLRLSGWVYEPGQGWRCLLKLGEHLKRVEEAEPKQPTPKDSAPHDSSPNRSPKLKTLEK